MWQLSTTDAAVGWREVRRCLDRLDRVHDHGFYRMYSDLLQQAIWLPSPEDVCASRIGIIGPIRDERSHPGFCVHRLDESLGLRVVEVITALHCRVSLPQLRPG